MSLTVALKDPDSAISRFFDRWLPHDDYLTRGWSSRLRRRWRLHPTPDLRVAHLTGPAIEMRIGYDLALNLPYLDLSEVLAPTTGPELWRAMGYAPPVEMRDAPPRLWQNQGALVPSLHLGNIDEQLDLLHHCWRLAYVDDIRRVLASKGVDERALPGLWELANNREIGTATTNALIGSWQNYLAHGRQQLQACGDHALTRPVFADGFAVGDLVVGTTVIDVKFTHDPDESLTYCLRQILGYALADSDNTHGIDTIGVYHAREAHLQTWTVDQAITTVAAEAVDLATLRREFATAIETERAAIAARRNPQAPPSPPA